MSRTADDTDRQVALLVADQYDDRQLWCVYYRLLEAGLQVVIVGPDWNEYRGQHGVPARAERTVDEVEPRGYEAVVVPGGYAPDQLRRNEGVVRFVGEMHRHGRVVAAIAHGVSLLVSAGIIDGRRVTGHSAIQDDLVNAGGTWVDQEVVSDGNITTSRRTDDLPAFCRALTDRLH